MDVCFACASAGAGGTGRGDGHAVGPRGADGTGQLALGRLAQVGKQNAKLNSRLAERPWLHGESAITKSHLDLVAKIPGADKAKFDAAVKAAEIGCPVSKLFKAEISVSARLES